MDFSHFTVPQWFTSAIGVIVLMALWTAAKIWFEDMLRRRQYRRRLGQRSSDDASGPNSGKDWMDRLIGAMDRQNDAMTLNASVNTEVARTLSILTAKQDAILDSLRITQLEQHNVVERVKEVKDVIGLLVERLPQGA